MGAAQREEREPPAPGGSQFALLGGGNAGRVALGSAGSGRRGSSRHMTASFLCLPAFSPSAFSCSVGAIPFRLSLLLIYSAAIKE